MHKPVLLSEVLQMIAAQPTPPQFGIDATFGRGGHTRALLEKFSQLHICGLDQDDEAIAYAKQNFVAEINKECFTIQKVNWHRPEVLQLENIWSERRGHGWDFILADLGVSSPQLDQAERGFSFYHEGPLDMRMDQTQGLTAADIVNNWRESELVELFTKYGEVRRPQRVVSAIIKARQKKPLTSTLALSTIISDTEGWQRRGHHPATRYFLALRLEVNQELAGLSSGISHLTSLLRQGGILLVITFHSLEDRIIKYAFKESDQGKQLHKKVIVPSRAECLANPRARSAKMRVFIKESPYEKT